MSVLTSFFFFNDSATTEIYTLSLHDALPISTPRTASTNSLRTPSARACAAPTSRSEEHTSELQSQSNLVCRLLLEKKKRHGSPSISHRKDLPLTYISTSQLECKIGKARLCHT